MSEMMAERLNIVAAEPTQKAPLRQKNRKEETIEKFEKMWERDPEQFNPTRNAMEKARIKRTSDLILDFFTPIDKNVADLGCGWGMLTQQLCAQGAHVDAVDAATAPLIQLKAKEIANLSTLQDCLPRTKLNDDAYDLVISTEVIALLSPDDYRLFFSELSRLIKPKGYVVCSTALDIHAEDALQRFANLAETEFQIEKWVFSYHYLYIRMLSFITAPSRYITAARETEYRQKELNQRKGISRGWFRLNSTPFLGKMWSIVNLLLSPLINLFQQSHTILGRLEKITRFIWSDSGISHALFLGVRRPLVQIPSEETMPQEKKHKKEVWE